jgi:hypothetical protein
MSSMTTKNEKAPPATAKAPEVNVSEAGSASAPFLYFERASAFGHFEGTVRITLESQRVLPHASGGGVTVDRVVNAHLRMSVPAAQSLQRAIEGALLMMAPEKQRN